MGLRSGRQNGSFRACASPVFESQIPKQGLTSESHGKSGSASGGQYGALSRLSRARSFHSQA